MQFGKQASAALKDKGNNAAANFGTPRITQSQPLLIKGLTRNDVIACKVLLVEVVFLPENTPHAAQYCYRYQMHLYPLHRLPQEILPGDTRNLAGF